MQMPSKPSPELVDKALKQLEPIQGPVLDWLPEESLYSLIARNHFYRGHMSPSHTVHAFFGTLTGKTLQQNMSEIEVLVARTEGSLGHAQQVLEQHTLLRFYRIFMPAEQSGFIEPGRRTTDSMLKFPMALRTGPFRTKHPLKACPVCLGNDEQESGFPYWRLKHQFPGVWVCLEHDHGLREIAIKAKPLQKFLWQTPMEPSLLPLPAVLADRLIFQKFKELARMIIMVTSDKERGIDYLAASAAKFHRYLSKSEMTYPADWQKITYRVRVDQLCESFVEFTKDLRKHPGFSTLPHSAESSFQLLSRYLNGKSFVPPLDILVITAWIEQFAVNF